MSVKQAFGKKYVMRYTRMKKEASLRHFLKTWAFCIGVLLTASSLNAAPYGAMVVDARTGEILHSRNADTRLHPAGLTKLMTLYIAFYFIEEGAISLDDDVTITRNAAAERPIKLGLTAGQKIQLRYLIRGAGVGGANDAATAIAEALAGSEAKFVQLENIFAKRLGLENSSFQNAHGLTEPDHMMSVRDAAQLSIALRRDFPEYWNLFGRETSDAGIKTVEHPNRRFLNDYKGVEAVKFGYTRAAGFNSMALAERDGKQVLAIVFGGRSTATLNARLAELLDMGFARAMTIEEIEGQAESLGQCIDASQYAENCAGKLSEEICGAKTASCLQREMSIWKTFLPTPIPSSVTEALAECVLQEDRTTTTQTAYCKIFAIAEYLNNERKH